MTGSSRLLSQKIIQQARKIGFDAAGIAPADPLLTDRTALDRWLSEGRQGDMAYLARDPARRSEPGRVLPGARSVVVLAMNYYTDPPPSSPSDGSGKISRYAWGRDYHGVIEPKLEALEAFIIKNGEAAGEETLCRSYVDYGPVLEKAFARRAGLGFIGKNTLLITEGFGSWVFLAVILTTLELEAGSP
ncbi:MAG TPA: QueG-associated DUF1730 domain-containing protein, partial [Nitrospiria bacterium]|nr:QueG-associated DUF1730 domain-containing protein [Nitrospiria bacterium]